MKTKKYNDSKQQTASRLSSVIISLSTLLFLAACTADEEAMRPTTEGDFLTATATAPAEAFGSLSRASESGYSDLTLHYTSAQTDALTAYAVAENSISDITDENVTVLSFTTKGDGTEANPHLVWPQIKSGTPLYLTVNNAETQLWGTCTATEHGAALYFGELKPRHAKLSVKMTVKSNVALTDNPIVMTTMIKKAAAEAADASTQAWPTTGNVENTIIGSDFLTNADGSKLTEGATTGTATVSGIFAPQTLEEPLIFAYADGSWTLDLSKIAVTDGTEGQMANQLVAGQHLTVSVTLNMTTLGTPTVTLTGISAAATDSYTGGLSGAATYTVTYGETTVTCADLNALTDALTAAITAGATNISITGSISTFAEEAIANAFLVSSASDLTITAGNTAYYYIKGSTTDLQSKIETAISKGATTITVTGTVDATAEEAIAAAADDVTLTINGTTAYYIKGSNTDLQQNIAAAVTAGAKAITVSGDLTTNQLTAVKNGISGDGVTGIHLSLPQTKAIGYNAFYKCSALTAITLAEGTEIGHGAFYQCTNLATVNGTLSATIGKFAFDGCSALTEITLANVTGIGDYAFQNCTSLATVNGTLSGTIGYYAFYQCSALTEITLAEGTEIGPSAFAYCSKLATVNGTLSGPIGNSAFHNCPALTEITLADEAVIGDYAFSYCTGMTSLTLQGVVTSVGNGAFGSVGYMNGAYNCALTLASGQEDVSGLAPDITNKSWAYNTWASITITNTNE